MTVHPCQPCVNRFSPIKRILAFVLILLLMLPCVSVIRVAAAGSSIDDFYVTAVADHTSTKIHWWYHSGLRKYYLFLPADADRSALQVGFSADAATVTIGKKQIENGEITDALASGSEFILRCGMRCFRLCVLQSENLPAVYITTESGSLDYIHASKENKEPATITVVESGTVTLDEVKLKQIKGRGNSTWGFDKKPYNIKFDKKTDLFGMGKAKKWSLIASWEDDALIRNAAGFFAGAQLGVEYASAYRFVDLYINGEYLGNYLVCESVEVGSTRVDIHDLEEANGAANLDVDVEQCPQRSSRDDKGSRKWVELPHEPEDVSGGYLMELDYPQYYEQEVSGFVSPLGQCVTMKSPEYASEAEIAYISAFYAEAEEALCSETGYNSLGKHYSAYFDMDSFVAAYLLCELSNNLDAAISSFFLYKDTKDDKIHFCSPWDFDAAWGISFGGTGVASGRPDIWWANAIGYIYTADDVFYDFPVLNALAFRHEDFRAAAADAWNSGPFSSGSSLYDYLKSLSSEIRSSAIADRVRWKKSLAVNAPYAYDRAVQEVLRFVDARTANLTAAFSAPVAMLYYDNNGGSGNVYNHEIAHVGDYVTVNEGSQNVKVNPPQEDYAFVGWNTEPDGGGKTYHANCRIRLNSETTVLYAMWKKIPDGFAGKLMQLQLYLHRQLLYLQIWLRYKLKLG